MTDPWVARSNAGTMQSGEKSGVGWLGEEEEIKEVERKKEKKKGRDRETTVLLLGNDPFKLDEKF